MAKLSAAKNKAIKDKIKKILPAQVVDSLFDDKRDHKINVKLLIAHLRGTPPAS